MKSTTRLRELIQKKEILVAPGAVDALSAKLIEEAGYEAIYMTGFGTAASIFGVPDIGLLTMTEMVENAKRIVDSVKIPVIADADTGYGNHLNVARTVQEYEKAGVSSIHIEDQIMPKKCGHMEGHKLISIEDMVAKVRAAAASKKDKDFVLIIRSDAISAEGFDQAIRRSNIYLEEGADLIFVEAPKTIEQLEMVPKLIQGPVLINIAPKTPNLHYKEYEEMGFAMAIYPLISLIASITAIRAKLVELKENGVVGDGGKGGLPFDEMVELLGIKKYRDMEEKILKKV